MKPLCQHAHSSFKYLFKLFNLRKTTPCLDSHPRQRMVETQAVFRLGWQACCRLQIHALRFPRINIAPRERIGLQHKPIFRTCHSTSIRKHCKLQLSPYRRGHRKYTFKKFILHTYLFKEMAYITFGKFRNLTVACVLRAICMVARRVRPPHDIHHFQLLRAHTHR